MVCMVDQTLPIVVSQANEPPFQLCGGVEKKSGVLLNMRLCKTNAEVLHHHMIYN